MDREKILVRQFEMIPKVEEKVLEETEAKANPADEKWYSIDNDNYEVKPVRVTLLPDAVNVFAPPKWNSLASYCKRNWTGFKNKPFDWKKICDLLMFFSSWTQTIHEECKITSS